MSGNQTLLLPILSLGNIPIVMTTLYTIDNLSLSGIHNRWRRPRMLVLGAQSQNVIESVTLVDNF